MQSDRNLMIYLIAVPSVIITLAGIKAASSIIVPLLLAFMFNFIPNIGSIIAAVPPMLLALADHGLAMSLWVGLFFLAINIVFGVMIEPRITGKGLGLSSVAVLLSLIFWGWILGHSSIVTTRIRSVPPACW
jgi:AI-2 transport protein TqsA